MLKKMSKEELELLSYTKIAQLYLEESKTTLSTADLFKEVCKFLFLYRIIFSVFKFFFYLVKLFLVYFCIIKNI